MLRLILDLSGPLVSKKVLVEVQNYLEMLLIVVV